jgi:hypothetical protein
MAGKLIKSTFTTNKRLVILTSHWRVMTISAIAQETNNRSRILGNPFYGSLFT